jgi:hypothetical protein
MTLTPAHLTMLRDESGIAEAIIAERGYRSLTSPEALVTLPKLGFSTQVARLGSGLLFPLTLPEDPVPLYQFRPDRPQKDDDRRPRKYEIPFKRPQRLILHPRTMAALRSGTAPLYVTEGAKKVDSLLSRGATALGGIGVWSFTVRRTAQEKKRGTPKVLLPDWEKVGLQGRQVIIVFDSDAALNTDVDRAEAELGALLRTQGAQVSRVRLPAAPDGSKQGIDDFFAHGHSLANVEALTQPLPRPRFDTISAEGLYHKPLSPLAFVIPGKLPAGATLFIGRGKDGKSLMVWNLAMAVVTGGKALGAYDVAQGAVLYLALEDGERRGKQRLFDQMDHMSMAAPPRGLDLVFWHAPRIGEGFLERLETWVDEHPDGRLVIVDILEKVRPVRSRDGVYADDYRALEALQQFGQRHNIAILVVHHSNKTKPDDFRDTVNGSMGLTGGCDTFWSLHRMADAPDATLKMLGRDIEQQALTLRFQDGFWTVTEEPAPAQMREERQAILTVLAQSPEPLSPLRIATALDKPVNAIKRLVRKMAMLGVVVQPMYGVYALPSFSPLSNGNCGNSSNCGNCGNCGNSVYNYLETQKLTYISSCPNAPTPEELPPEREELPFLRRVTAVCDGGNSSQPYENNGVMDEREEELPQLPPLLIGKKAEFRQLSDNVDVNSKNTAASLPGGTLPHCVFCRGTVFWAGAVGQPICSRCHPRP